MTKKVRFNRNYDLRLNPRQVAAVQTGTEMTLADAKADELLEKGVAELVDDPKSAKKKNG
jgi:hypothetical protein